MKNQNKNLKTFEEYFVPYNFKVGTFNPNYIH